MIKTILTIVITSIFFSGCYVHHYSNINPNPYYMPMSPVIYSPVIIRDSHYYDNYRHYHRHNYRRYR